MNDVYMTWRDVRDFLNGLDDELLDETATVWLPHDVGLDCYDEFQGFVRISPYDSELPPGADNPLSFETGA